MPCFVGLDWASTAHAVCVIDEQGHIRRRASSPIPRPDSPSACVGFTALAPQRRSALRSAPLGRRDRHARGRRLPVVPIHPNVVKASRPRYSSAGRRVRRRRVLLAACSAWTGPASARWVPCPTRPAPCAPSSAPAHLVAHASRSPQLRAVLGASGPRRRHLRRGRLAIALTFLTRYPTPQSPHASGTPARPVPRPPWLLGAARRRLLARLRRRLSPARRASRAPLHALIAILPPSPHNPAALAAIVAPWRTIPTPALPEPAPQRQVNAAQLLAELGDDRARFPSASTSRRPAPRPSPASQTPCGRLPLACNTASTGRDHVRRQLPPCLRAAPSMPARSRAVTTRMRFAFSRLSVCCGAAGRIGGRTTSPPSPQPAFVPARGQSLTGPADGLRPVAACALTAAPGASTGRTNHSPLRAARPRPGSGR